MRLFGRKKPEKRAETVVVSADELWSALDPDSMDTGKALEIPALQYCIELLSGMISALPLKLYEEKDGRVKEIKNDIRVRLINGDTGDTINGTMCRKMWVRDYFFLWRRICLHTAGYLRKSRSDILC